MTRVATRLIVIAAVLAASAVLAPAAGAAVTIGQLFTPTAQTTATVAQTGASNGVNYTVPSDGVITSWGFLADSEGAKVRLKILRRNGDGTFTVVGESALETAAPGQQQTFATRIPVRAGDYLGSSATSGKTVAYTGAQTDAVVLAPGDQPAGSSGSYSDVQGIRIDATASIEPDADLDGFGDETQDVCPTDPSLQTRCSADLTMTVTPDKRAVHPGEEITFALTVHNNGPSAATGVQLIAELSPELSLAGTAGAVCDGGLSLDCTLVDIPKDGDVTVNVVAKALLTGPATVAARTGSNTDDANQANNAAGGSVAIVWLPGRCSNAFPAGNDRDVVRGTTAGDLIAGLGGNDVLSGLSGPDCLDGGDGDDRILGGGGNDRIDGGDGDDRIAGGPGKDRIDGGDGDDRINAGRGADRVDAGPGDDVLVTADGVRDSVNCGAGRDRVRADRGDRLRRCETVRHVKVKRRAKRRRR